MITVEEAKQIISEKSRDFGVESVALDQAMGRVLRENIYADRDLPPYDRVTMDGIAIRYEQFVSGQRDFPIAGVAAAGAAQAQLKSHKECLEVMTGAVMPLGADTIIPYEKINTQDGLATLATHDIRLGQNIHTQGSDRPKGTLIFSQGRKISSAEIGVCATVGKTQVKVSRLPKTLIISSGDELVDIDQMPQPHQIRRSNVFRLLTAMKHYGADVTIAHLLDDYAAIVKALSEYLSVYDLLIISGGVSKGKFDYLPDALAAAGVTKHFHKIKQRPGKPFWFGSIDDRATVFAFPGNPVSSFMCMQHYLKPWLDECLQLDKKPLPKAQLSSDVHFKPDLTYFLEVKLSTSDEGILVADPAKGNGSGDLANLVDADAFLILPRGRDDFSKGEAFPLIIYRENFL